MPSFTAPAPPPDPKPILELEGEEYEDEIAALTDWVDDHLMDVYGAEITTAAPWCEQWQEHLDVVAWLHALWMAYQQHKDPEPAPVACSCGTGTSSPTAWLTSVPPAAP